METLRDGKIKEILAWVKKDNIDADGIIMMIPSPEAYQSFENFLRGIIENLFALLAPGSAERLPGGTIILNWRDGKNKIVLGTLIGKDFANFFYSPKKGDRFSASTQSVEELLTNDFFLSSVRDFLAKLEAPKLNPLNMNPTGVPHVANTR